MVSATAGGKYGTWSGRTGKPTTDTPVALTPGAEQEASAVMAALQSPAAQAPPRTATYVGSILDCRKSHFAFVARILEARHRSQCAHGVLVSRHRRSPRL